MIVKEFFNYIREKRKKTVVYGILRNIYIRVRTVEINDNTLTLFTFTWKALDFKLSPCSESYILSFGSFPDVWIFYADLSEHSVCSIFIGGASRKFLLTPLIKIEKTVSSETSVYKIQQTKQYNLKVLIVPTHKTATLLPHRTDIKGKSIIFIDKHNMYWHINSRQ